MAHSQLNLSHEYLKNDTSSNQSWIFPALLIGSGLVAGFLTKMAAARDLKWVKKVSNKLSEVVFKTPDSNKNPQISYNEAEEKISSSQEEPLSQSESYNIQDEFVSPSLEYLM